LLFYFLWTFFLLFSGFADITVTVSVCVEAVALRQHGIIVWLSFSSGVVVVDCVGDGVVVDARHCSYLKAH
jgi:hypothetical protein